MKKFAALVLVSALIAPLAATPAEARDGRFNQQRGYHRAESRGHWYQGRHNGRMGRWWVVGNTWLFYPPYTRAVYSAPAYRAPVVTVTFGPHIVHHW